MFNWFKSDAPPGTAHQLYGSIVTQAKRPHFYRAWGVPDTLEGRFELVVLHLYLVLARLRSLGEAARELERDLVDSFFSGMNDDVRELGASPQAAPKKMRKTAEALYGRMQAYGQALGEDDGGHALVAAIERNVYGGHGHDAGADPDGATLGEAASAAAPGAPNPAALARYVLIAATELSGQGASALSTGTVSFPDPEQVDQP